MVERSFILVPGAGGMAWFWRRIVAHFDRAGREAIAVDLPADDSSKGLRDYADIVAEAIGTRLNVMLVAQSLAGFTAPLVRAPDALRGLILVNAMIPPAGRSPRGLVGQYGRRGRTNRGGQGRGVRPAVRPSHVLSA